MTNKEIANQFNLLAQLMELQDENPFKIRSYSGAYIGLRKLPFEAITAPYDKLLEIKGIGKAIADKIVELRNNGTIQLLESYKEKTPEGIVELLGIKGLGAKKIAQLWKELGVESPGELLYACEENRLIELKGFGEKTQDEIRRQVGYYLDSRGYYLFGHIYNASEFLMNILRDSFRGNKFCFTGEFARKMPVVAAVDILTTAKETEIQNLFQSQDELSVDGNTFFVRGIEVQFNYCDPSQFNQLLFRHSCSDEFYDMWQKEFAQLNTALPEEDLFAAAQLPFIPSEARENPGIIVATKTKINWELLEEAHIKGVIHNHSTWSDGVNSIAEMADYCKIKGYEYLVMSDHSKSAFYANGLDEKRLMEQWNEIDQINQSNPGFHIYKSIESDILYSGELDYDDSILSAFDLVIASVHSILKMDEEKATSRLIKAVENPYTRILGHPTGRLLLSRKGYPINHIKIIDACSANGVAIELNANPYRLDIDWSWIPYAVERNVLISVNPDAHSTKGIDDIRFGVFAARKGGLQKDQCLNCMDRKEFEIWLQSR